MNEIKNEDKVTKSLRNTKEFKQLFVRANKGEFDVELDDARESGELVGTSQRLPLLKVTEKWSIRKQFDIESGKDRYHLYKEKFYIQNPGSNYVDTIDKTIYRKVVKQHESGDLDWAKRVADHFNIDLEGQE